MKPIACAVWLFALVTADAGGGFNLLFGVEHESGLFVEAKAGFVDSPDFKLGVGHAFR